MTRTVHLLEHLVHPLDIIMIQEPRLRILLVLLERDPKRVRYIDRFAVVLPQEDADDSLGGVPRDGAGVVVGY